MLDIETHLDFVGQYRAEVLYRVIISLFGFIGIAWGYHVQQFSQTFLVLAAGFAVALLVTLPPWPFYRRHPLKWQKPVPEPTPASATTPPAEPVVASAGAEEKTKKKKN